MVFLLIVIALLFVLSYFIAKWFNEVAEEKGYYDNKWIVDFGNLIYQRLSSAGAGVFDTISFQFAVNGLLTCRSQNSGQFRNAIFFYFQHNNSLSNFKSNI